MVDSTRPESTRGSGRFDNAVESVVGTQVRGADLGALKASLDLVRLATRWMHHLEHAVHRPAGWSFSGFRIMFCVWAMGELEPREIARLSGLTRATISSALNKLEDDGLLSRSRDHDDGRLVTVRLTEAGADRIAAAYAAQNCLEAEFFGQLGDDAAAFRSTLAALLAQPLPQPGQADPAEGRSQ